MPDKNFEKPPATVRILGIDFRTNGPSLPESLTQAGLVVVPSGPGLAIDLRRSAAYRHALRGADWVIPDSGLMVLVWNAIHWRTASKRLERYSGLRLLREVLPRPEIQEPGVTFWIMPNESERDRNVDWLQRHGFRALTTEDCYIAPMYQRSREGVIEDPELISRLERRRPGVVFLNVGGGTQEQLGWYLRSKLTYRPAILCTGAAIAFLTGGQAAIPPWADRFYLGWLLRIFENPVKFGRRYWASIGLVASIIRHRDKSPVVD